MSSCFLCFQEDCVIIYKTSECLYQESNVLQLIRIHINLVLDNDSVICSECWKQIRSWHNFYTRIYSIQIESNKNCFIKKNCSEAEILEKESAPCILLQTVAENCETNKFVTKSSLLKTREGTLTDTLVKEEILEPARPIPVPSFQTSTVLKAEDLERKEDIEDEIDKKLNEHINYECNFCKEILPSFKKLVRHILNVHKKKGYALCCNIKLFDRTLAIEHINRYHSKIQILHKCPECERQFFNLKTLNNHRVLKHNINKQNLFPCTFCENVSFERIDQLKKHDKDNHKEKEFYNCTKCTKIFKEKNKLRDHFVRVHSLTAPEHICDICGLCFKTKGGFNNHHKEVHQGIVKPKEKCDLCGNMVKNLRKHKYMTHPPDNVIIKCDVCNKIISTWNALYNHKQHAHGEKKFVCEVCRKAFKEFKLLKEHVATHTGQPLYQCAYCSTTFKCEANYFKHRKRIHQEEMKKDKRAKINLN